MPAMIETCLPELQLQLIDPGATETVISELGTCCSKKKMSKSEENRDSRQSHHLCHNLAGLIKRIETEYAAAKTAKDAGVYRTFNDTYVETRQQLAARKK